MPAPSAESRGGGHLPPWRADVSLYPQGLSPHLYRIKQKITACLASLLPSPFTAPHPTICSPSVLVLSGEEGGIPHRVGAGALSREERLEK